MGFRANEEKNISTLCLRKACEDQKHRVFVQNKKKISTLFGWKKGCEDTQHVVSCKNRKQYQHILFEKGRYLELILITIYSDSKSK